MRNIFSSLFAVVAAAACLAYCSAEGAFGQDKKRAEKEPAAEIEKLVKQLGSVNAKTRETASKALLKIGEEALPALKVAVGDSDLETSRRAKGLLSQINQSVQDARFRDRIQISTKYGIDVLVARMARKGKRATEEDWQVLAEIIATLRVDGKAKGAQFATAGFTRVHYPKMPVEVGSDFKGDEFGLINNSRIIAANIDTRGIGASLVVNGGKVKSGGVITGGSVVFANGDFFSSGVLDSLVICDGNVTMGYAQRSVILAREKVKLILATGSKGNAIEDHYQTGFTNIRFFSIRDLGIQLAGGGEATDGLVGVVRVEPGSLLDKTGLKVGDQIAAVNGEKLTESENARKLFRRALVEGTIVIERHGQSTLKIDVP